MHISLNLHRYAQNNNSPFLWGNFNIFFRKSLRRKNLYLLMSIYALFSKAREVFQFSTLVLTKSWGDHTPSLTCWSPHPTALSSLTVLSIYYLDISKRLKIFSTWTMIKYGSNINLLNLTSKIVSQVCKTLCVPELRYYVSTSFPLLNYHILSNDNISAILASWKMFRVGCRMFQRK